MIKTSTILGFIIGIAGFAIGSYYSNKVDDIDPRIQPAKEELDKLKSLYQEYVDTYNLLADIYRSYSTGGTIDQYQVSTLKNELNRIEAEIDIQMIILMEVING